MRKGKQDEKSLLEEENFKGDFILSFSISNDMRNEMMDSPRTREGERKRDRRERKKEKEGKREREREIEGKKEIPAFGTDYNLPNKMLPFFNHGMMRRLQLMLMMKDQDCNPKQNNAWKE